MIHLIAKPLKGKKEKLYGQIEEKLREEGAEYEFHFTTRGGEAREFAGRCSAAGDVLVAVGGDGTLNEVLSGMDPALCPLGIIPAGTGNDFAVCAGIPSGIAALDLILHGEPKKTDYIAFSDGRRSLNIAGLGIDVDILLRCERNKRFRFRSKYFFSLISSLFRYRGCEMKIAANGEQTEGNMLLAAVCNGRQFGGGIPICPPADISDGKLELILVDCPKRTRIPFALIRLMKGRVLDLPFAHRITCESCELVLAQAGMAQYDGELKETGSLSARVVHGELGIFRG